VLSDDARVSATVRSDPSNGRDTQVDADEQLTAQQEICQVAVAAAATRMPNARARSAILYLSADAARSSDTAIPNTAHAASLDTPEADATPDKPGPAKLYHGSSPSRACAIAR
jgi:hypothetical protein